MTNKLEGKVAVVTGGGGGIGRGISLLAAKEGAKVVVADVGKRPDGTKAADSVVQEIVRAGGSAVASYGDVTTMAGGASIIKAAIDNWGRVDILVCCAGTSERTSIFDVTEEQFDRTIAVHIKGHFTVAKAAVPHMAKQRFGRIITVTSRGAFTSIRPAYGTAKAGVMGFTFALANELEPYGITVNSLSPSAVTPQFTTALDKRSGNDGMPRLGLSGDPEY
ncbi:MAG: SDR family NAD(P)-dependent oxidoreductase, partial [Chloroflexi bacterium]|nr:SDR family NAD(P)-dependent oxidoreductase [Chloroflexota bacterium]